MTFFEVVDQVLTILERRRRVSYRALQHEFDIDEPTLEALKAELISAQRVASDEEGLVLVWAGREGRAASHESGTSPPTREAERRQLTVMFCDLVGSTALSEQLDPEELREVVRAYQELCAGVIRRFGGYIAQYLGDGLLVYFGYPMAYEDEPQRAVWTGLGILEALPQLSFPAIQLPFPLQVRIGIHTGRVVVGEVGVQGRSEQLAIGEAPNIAARLQGLAEPNSALISAVTYRLVQRVFDCRTSGPQTLKGISSAVGVYQVLGERQGHARFSLSDGSQAASLIGREREVQFLAERWERSKRGEGQVVLLSGEAGIGKSRLVQELYHHVAQQEMDGAIRISLRCLPYYHNSALSPLIEHLQRVLEFTPDDTSQTKFAKLQHTLARYTFPDADTLVLFASLLCVPVPKTVPALQLSPQRQKQKIHEALIGWLLEEAEHKPVYFVWEDLHWADPSTLEFLSLYIDQVPAARVLAIAVFRPEFIPPWSRRSFVSHLSLAHLDPESVSELTLQVTAGKTLPTAIAQQIVSRTDGVPLFVEELTKMVIESDFLRETDNHYELTGPLPLLSIPTTLQDSLEARLDRLSTGKEVAQLGATLGQEFSYALIQAVSPLDEDRLQLELGHLVQVELLYQRGEGSRASYMFRQTLIQESAYQSLLKSKRQSYHHQIALALEERFPETLQTRPELVAHHFTEAGQTQQAIPYWEQAGQRAVESSANEEAVRHLQTGLALLERLPDTPERTQQELALRIALGTPLTATQGYTAPAVEELYTQALALCRQLGETPHLFLVLFGMWRFYLVAGKSHIARELAEQCLRQAESVNTASFLMTAHLMLGSTLCGFGELTAAQEHLEQSLDFYDAESHRPDRPYGALFGQDPRVVSLGYLASVLWLRGYPDQALARSREAVRAAQSLAHPFSLVLALNFAGVLHRFRGEQAAVYEHAEAVIALAREQGFAFWVPSGQLARGWALASQGQAEEGLNQIEQAISAWHAIGAGKDQSFVFYMQADAYRKGGRFAEGLAILENGIALTIEGVESTQQADLYRLKGEMLLEEGTSQGPVLSAVEGSNGKGQRSKVSTLQTKQVEAEECFQRAIAIAQRQDAKSLELRAVVSLSRLWQQQSKQDAARRRLAAIYDWFTEGFETTDLQEARELLEELSS